MKKKKPSFPTSPTYVERRGLAGTDSSSKEWYTPLLVRFKSLSRREAVSISIVSVVLALLIWRPPVQFIAACIIIVILMAVVVNGIARANPQVETMDVKPWAIRDDSALGAINQFNWTDTSGGPLLLLLGELMPLWEGTNVPSGGRVVNARFSLEGIGTPATDFDRACDVEGDLGLINVGEGQGLVLGGELMPTAWWPADGSESGGTLIRQNYTSDDDDVIQAVSELPDHLWEPTGLLFNAGREPLYLFDSAHPGISADDLIEIKLAAGTYSILTCEYAPAKDAFLVMHCFVRQDKAT